MAIRRTKRGFVLTDEHARDYVRMVANDNRADGNEQEQSETNEIVALLAVQQENKRLRGALSAIACGTPDLLPPYRAMEARQLREIASKTLRESPEKANEQRECCRTGCHILVPMNKMYCLAHK